MPLRNVLDIMCSTLNVDQIIDGLFKAELLNQEGLLLFRNFIEEVFKVAIPNFSNFSEESFSNSLVSHICEDLSQQEVVMSNIRMFRSPLG
jgi:hypothetical protein